MKKTISILLATILLLALATNCFADSDSDIVYETENKSVIFSSETKYTFEEQQYISNKLIYGKADNNSVQPRAWCWLVGHELTSEYVTVITHKAYDTAPRCISELYEVTTCANCDYEEMTLVSTGAISCCPVE